MSRLFNKYILIILGIIIFYPLSSFAAGIDYGSILSQSTDSFVLKYGNTEIPDYYNCTVSALSCTDIGKTHPTLPTNPIASTPQFIFFTSSLWKNNIHTRIFYLKNNVTGKIYTRSYKLNSWDTLGDEGTIFSFSPDDKKLVYQDDSSGYPVLYQLDLTTLKGHTFTGKRVFSKSFSVSGFTLTSSTNLYFMSNKDSSYEWNLYKYNFSNKKTSVIANNASYALMIRKFNNGFVFFTIQGSSSFPVFYNEQTNQVEKFSGIATDSSIPTINSKAISLAGGTHGVLMTPQNFNKNQPHTLVIWLHGGPYRQTSIGFQPYTGYAVYDLILNNMVENNVVVLKLDYRGSYGYGVKLAESIKGNVGKGDVTDVVNALALTKKDINISDTYLMGNSYGGYLALRSIVAYPKQFKGAISINGVTDWATLLNTLHNSVFNTDFNGAPNKNNAKLYANASILSRVGNLTDQKIILIQAQADKTIPPSQADLMYNALKNQGKNVEFYPYANEDHTFVKISSLDGICQNVFTTLSLPLNDNCNFD